MCCAHVCPTMLRVDGAVRHPPCFLLLVVISGHIYIESKKRLPMSVTWCLLSVSLLLYLPMLPCVIVVAMVSRCVRFVLKKNPLLCFVFSFLITILFNLLIKENRDDDDDWRLWTTSAWLGFLLFPLMFTTSHSFFVHVGSKQVKLGKSDCLKQNRGRVLRACAEPTRHGGKEGMVVQK